jgi:hypothetical protein
MVDRFAGQASAPGWWLGAPLLGVVFGFVANRLFPEFIRSAAGVVYRLSGNGTALSEISADSTRFLAPLVGMVLAVVGLAAWRVVRSAMRPRTHA